MEDLISIVVPVYNVEKYLDKCVKSIINQTYQNLEIILVNDGSTDNSGKICDELAKKDERIKVIHKENGGLSDARNVGIKQTKGRLIGFVDSDDYIKEDMYETLYDDLKKYDADIAICNMQKVDEEGNKLEELKDENDIKIVEKKEALKCLIEDNISGYAVDKLYKIELFNSIEYPKGRKMEDSATTYKLLDAANKVVYYHKVGYYYVQRKGSISHEMDSSYLVDWNYAIIERYNYLTKKYSELEDDLAIRRLEFFIITVFFFCKFEDNNEKLKKVVDGEYEFFKKHYQKYKKQIKKNKTLKQQLQYDFLYFSKLIFIAENKGKVKIKKLLKK